MLSRVMRRDPGALVVVCALVTAYLVWNVLVQRQPVETWSYNSWYAKSDRSTKE